jgi:hypothetical protein
MREESEALGDAEEHFDECGVVIASRQTLD